MQRAPTRKNAITVTEAFLLAVMSYFTLGLWREVLEGVSRKLFGDNRWLAAAAFTGVLVAMLTLFKNVDVGKSSLYEIV